MISNVEKRRRDKIALAKTKHGHARDRTTEYHIWAGMIKRCRNPKCKAFENYGGRGITVCDRWNDYVAFLADMGPRPSPSHTLDRIKNDEGYGPDNCRWATWIEQARNRRPRKKKTVCASGHPLSGDNLLAPGADGVLRCRACNRRYQRATYLRRKARLSSQAALTLR